MDLLSYCKQSNFSGIASSLSCKLSFLSCHLHLGAISNKHESPCHTQGQAYYFKIDTSFLLGLPTTTTVTNKTFCSALVWHFYKSCSIDRLGEYMVQGRSDFDSLDQLGKYMVPSRSNFDSLDRLQIYMVPSRSALDSIDRLQIYMVSSWPA